MIQLYFSDPRLYLLPLTDLGAEEEDLNSLYLNQNGRLVQLVAQQERNIGFFHVQDTCQHESNPNSSMCCGLGEERTEILRCL